MPEPAPRPVIASSPISVILIARALATETSDVLQSWRHYLDTLRRPYEILLIQETRSDIADTSSAEVPDETTRLRIFPYDRAAGFRDAYNHAIRAAQHPLLAFSTCDSQYAPNDLDRLLKIIDQVDLVVGYRAGGQAPPWRVLLDIFVMLASRILIGVPWTPRVCWLGSEGRGRRWIARWIFGVRVLDPECPFRLARREIFQRLPIQSSGPFVQVEMLAKANHLMCLLAEEGVKWNPPAAPLSDAISFGSDAYLVFREPDFGPSEAQANDSLPTNGAAVEPAQPTS